jgi:hypothetical protein
MPNSTPQTLTTMEAGFTVNPADAEEFWRHQERMGPIAAAAPGFLGVIGGPIARSPWLYFCGKWQTPELMNQWFHDAKHKPMMQAAHSRWFGACYIRKWRLPAEGEAISGPVFCETAIASDVAASAATIGSIGRCRNSIRGHSRRSLASRSGSLFSSWVRCRNFRRSRRSAICCLRIGSRPKMRAAGLLPTWQRSSPHWARYRRRLWSLFAINPLSVKV